MNVYVVLRNSDLEEGRGPFVLDAVFANDTLAVQYAEEKFDYYHHGAIAQGWARIATMPVFESTSEWRRLEREKIRAQALAKLTPEEREILGL